MELSGLLLLPFGGVLNTLANAREDKLFQVLFLTIIVLLVTLPLSLQIQLDEGFEHIVSVAAASAADLSQVVYDQDGILSINFN